MPWTANDAHTHIHGLSEAQASAWAKIANSALAACQKNGGSDCDGRAIRIANAAAKRVGKSAHDLEWWACFFESEYLMDLVEKAGKTKSVGGTELPASAFAYVGDPEDPETWKLPVHDASHARNALARENQTEGIPADEKAKVHAKIVAAAKKHGVDVTEKQFVIAKIDEAQRLVFGWASVAEDSSGVEVEDLQGDIVSKEDLEPAVYDFVEHSRVGTDLHPADDAPAGTLIESVMITPEKLEAMGLTAKSAPRSGWWTGFKFSPEAFAKVATGERRMFSIKGAADRVEA